MTERQHLLALKHESVQTPKSPSTDLVRRVDSDYRESDLGNIKYPNHDPGNLKSCSRRHTRQEGSARRVYYSTVWCLGGREPTPFLPELPTVKISYCGQLSILTGTPHGNLRRHTTQLSVGLVLSNSLHRNIRRGTRQLSAGSELPDSPHRNIKRHELPNPPQENLGRHTRQEGSA